MNSNSNAIRTRTLTYISVSVSAGCSLYPGGLLVRATRARRSVLAPFAYRLLY